jgi:hypothetical protein
MESYPRPAERATLSAGEGGGVSNSSLKEAACTRPVLPKERMV